jgi:hypothetical protein
MRDAMPAVYVLDVPEFRALVRVAREEKGYSITRLPGGYFRIESATELVFKRKELSFKPAVWYGCVTGGLRGHIVQFDRDTLRIVAGAQS